MKKEKATAEIGPSYGRLCNVEQIGVTTADAMCAFFSEGHNVEIIKDLRKQLTVEAVTRRVVADDAPLKDKIVVFTGELSTMTREAAKARAEELGAKVTELGVEEDQPRRGRRECRLQGPQGRRARRADADRRGMGEAIRLSAAFALLGRATPRGVTSAP